MKVRVDDAACQGHGRCYALAPEVFEPDDHGHCLVVHADIASELEGAARTGADNCPEGAITLEND